MSTPAPSRQAAAAVDASGGETRAAAHLRTVLADYQEHCNTARPHQGIAQRIPAAASYCCRPRARTIHRKPVLGGLINEYSRAA